MTHKGRSNCGHLTLSDVGREVQMAGWVDALRDHGDVIFIHLRDRSGIVQVVFSPASTPPRYANAPPPLEMNFVLGSRVT